MLKYYDLISVRWEWVEKDTWRSKKGKEEANVTAIPERKGKINI